MTFETDNTRLIEENLKLKEQTEALSNAAQVIGQSLKGRLKDIEAKHEAERVKDTINKAETRREELRQENRRKKARNSSIDYRDISFFLAGLLTSSFAFAFIAAFAKHKSS